MDKNIRKYRYYLSNNLLKKISSAIEAESSSFFGGKNYYNCIFIHRLSDYNIVIAIVAMKVNLGELRRKFNKITLKSIKGIH